MRRNPKIKFLTCKKLVMDTSMICLPELWIGMCCQILVSVPLHPFLLIFGCHILGMTHSSGDRHRQWLATSPCDSRDL